tara:strand:- start:24856 stop:25821 length:966 start_codon:yes stop_codon:yes gene_type:complete
MNNNILITGCAGFIGFHIALKFSNSGYNVIGIDNINNYYDTKLKEDRLNVLSKSKNFIFYKLDITDKKISDIFKKNNIKHVIHLAAQAGVRYSLENPFLYINSNITGFVNILECCKDYNIKSFFYASSSSVYGNNDKNLNENDLCNKPESLYGATKISNEIIAHTYSSLYQINSIGLRFFTVYGPWGRPDMAYYSFTKAISNGKKIKIYNKGKHKRAFTYIDDITHSIFLLFNKFKNNDKYCEVLNIGGNNSINLIDFVKKLENLINNKAIIENFPKQPGDVENTSSDCRKLEKLINFSPQIDIDYGLNQFVTWYEKYNSQ